MQLSSLPDNLDMSRVFCKPSYESWAPLHLRLFRKVSELWFKASRPRHWSFSLAPLHVAPGTSTLGIEDFASSLNMCLCLLRGVCQKKAVHTAIQTRFAHQRYRVQHGPFSFQLDSPYNVEAGSPVFFAAEHWQKLIESTTASQQLLCRSKLQAWGNKTELDPFLRWAVHLCEDQMWGYWVKLHFVRPIDCSWLKNRSTMLKLDGFRQLLTLDRRLRTFWLDQFSRL